MTTAELYFGRAIRNGREVTDLEWRHFLAEEVTPRFPDGFSVSENYGQWRGPDGKIVGERSMKLFIVLSGKTGEDADIEAVRSRYKERFKQDSVLLIEDKACAGF